MIYYLEHDSAGNIYHVACSIDATITPLVPMAILKDAKGDLITPFADPVGITSEQFNQLLNHNDDFVYDIATETIVPRVANAPATA
ncbi:hypothetical protein [Tunturiibacter gelidiferens]|uniref:hypothetical protein n=1 Tax=Tunturiibacter gelidiferens TaxID=3069689 RepID=UPI003D9ACB33